MNLSKNSLLTAFAAGALLLPTHAMNMYRAGRMHDFGEVRQVHHCPPPVKEGKAYMIGGSLATGIRSNDIDLIRKAIKAGISFSEPIVEIGYWGATDRIPYCENVRIPFNLATRMAHRFGVLTLKMLLATPNLNINQQDKEGLTALHEAIPCPYTNECLNSEQAIPIIRLLLAHGADPEIKTITGTYLNPKGETVYDWAKKENRHDLIPIIKEGRAKYLSKQTQEVVAAVTPLPRPVAGLVSEYLYGPVERTKAGTEEMKQVTASMAEHKGEAAQQIETKHKVEISPEDQAKLNAQLIDVVLYGNPQEVPKLVIAGAQVNARGGYRNTPLITAATLGNVAMVRTLLDTPDIQINLENAGGRTALIEAVINNKPEIVELLLKRGADATIRDGDKLTAYDYAEKKPMIRALIERSQKTVGAKT